jgi:hypothetical protein
LDSVFAIMDASSMAFSERVLLLLLLPDASIFTVVVEAEALAGVVEVVVAIVVVAVVVVVVVVGVVVVGLVVVAMGGDEGGEAAMVGGEGSCFLLPLATLLPEITLALLLLLGAGGDDVREDCGAEGGSVREDCGAEGGSDGGAPVGWCAPLSAFFFFFFLPNNFGIGIATILLRDLSLSTVEV